MSEQENPQLTPYKIQGYGWVPQRPDRRDYLFSVPFEVLGDLPPTIDMEPRMPPVYDQSQLGSCHDEKTEVLTDGGWILFSSLRGEEKLASINPATQELRYEQPSRLIRLPYKGDLICASNESLDFAVTPDHKMVVYKWDKKTQTLSREYEFVDAKDIGGDCGLMNRIIWNGEESSDAYAYAYAYTFPDTIYTMSYEGEVFCAEVPTYHTLVTRRNGKILVSGNCTANSIAGLVEYRIRNQGEVDFTPSRLFIYYNERFMENSAGYDSGAEIRDGIKSINQVGVCPETMWPYDISQFTKKPSDNCYIEAILHKSLQYEAVLQDLSQIKGALAADFPVCFGFSVYQSFESSEVAATGIVPMPASGESCLGGHAVLLVGYDDSRQMFKVRNSWGSTFALNGYVWMPYSYVLDANLASDFWVIKLMT